MLLATLLVAAGIIWAWMALRLFSPPANVCEGCAEDWFRRTQLALAAGGIVSMAVAVAYLIHIARTGRTWRRRRAVTAVLAVFVLFWIGKNHNVPEQDVAPGGSCSEWPTQIGFDRFYGFLGGETNNCYPYLVEDNHFIEAPSTPEEGYHLSKDLADKAIEMLRNKNATNPSKPFYMWFNPGAIYAPHHSPADYTAKYKGKFDDGYDAYRDWVVARMKEKELFLKSIEMAAFSPMPEDAAYPADYVRPWEELNDSERKLFARYGRGLCRIFRIHRCPGGMHHRLS